MAKRGTLTVRIIGDTKGLEKSLGGVGGKLGKFAKGAAAAGAAVAGAIAVPVKAFADFDQAMTQSLAIMGDVSDSMRKEMSDAARQVAKTTTFSAAEAAESYFFLASAGMDAEQSIAALPQVAAFAQAGMFDMATATDLATDAQSALGLASDDAKQNLENLTRVTDVLVGANTLANASVEQFSEALTNKAGAAMRSVGMEIEEGLAVLAAFADQGVKGAEAGTQFAIVLRDLQTRALQNAEQFAAAGVAVFDANGEFRNMADILGDLEGRLDGMSDAQKKAELATLGFSDKSIAALQTLIGTSEAVSEYEQKLRDMGGITKEVAEKQLQTFWAQVELIRDQLVDFAITIGEHVVPVILRAFQGVRNWWGTNGPAIQGFVQGLWDKFTTAFDAIRTIFASFRGSLDSSQSTLQRWRDAGSSILQSFGDLFGRVGSAISEVFNDIRTWLNDNRETVARWAQNASDLFSRVGEFIAATVKFISTVVQRAIDVIMFVWNNGGQHLFESTMEKFNAIARVVGSVLGWITDSIRTWSAVLQGDWTAAWQILGPKFVQIANGIVKAVESFLNLIVRAVNRTFKELSARAGPFGALADRVFGGDGPLSPVTLGRVTLGAMGGVSDGFTEGARRAGPVARQQWEKAILAGAIEEPTAAFAASDMPDLGEDLAGGMADGLSGGGGGGGPVQDAVDEIMDDIEDRVRDGAQAMSSILSQSFSLGSARENLREAQAELDELLRLKGTGSSLGEMQAQFNRVAKALSRAERRDREITASEELDIIRAEERVAEARRRVNEAETEQDRHKATLELQVAEEELNKTREDAVALSRDTIAMQEQINELFDRWWGLDEEIADAQDKVHEAQLALIESQGRFNDELEDFDGLGGRSVDAFVEMATQAGLTAEAIDSLVEKFRDLMGVVDPGAQLGASDWAEVARRINTSPAIRSAVIAAGINPGSTTDVQDVIAALQALGINFGSQVNLGDLDALIGATMHSGGMVHSGIPRTPGLRSDERLIRAQVGEYVTPRGGGGVTVVLNVAGSVQAERDLVRTVQAGVREAERRNGRTGF